MMNFNNNLSQGRVLTSLPDHLILEHILPRLPVRSLHRFKSVSQEWFHTISHHNFAKSHLKFSSCRPQQFIVLANDSQSDNYAFYSLSYDDADERRNRLKAIVLPLNFDNGLLATIDIVGSCNGLVCLYREFNQHRTFYLWNPATRQCRELDQIDELEEMEPFMFTAAYGFGYASSIDEYKIVAIFTTYTDDFSSHLYVYSSKIGKWRRTYGVLDDCRVSTIGIHKGISINDRVYWPLRSRNHGQQIDQIVGFDLVDEQLEVNPWMSWLLRKSETNLPLFEIQGCLSLCRYIDDTCLDVWMLKNRDDWNSWEKLFILNVEHIEFFHFSKNGKCFVHHLKQLKVLDQGEEGRLQETEIAGYYNGHIWEAGGYGESFVSPF